MSWNQNSGFNVHVRKPFDDAGGEAIERLARFMSRARCQLSESTTMPRSRP